MPRLDTAKFAQIADFFRCPNTGDIIEGTKGDDKVLCPCGKTNPRVAHKEATTESGLVVHVRCWLKSATLEEYLAFHSKRAGRAAEVLAMQLVNAMKRGQA